MRTCILSKYLMPAALMAAAIAPAAPIVVTSYDMPNGQGQASGGTFNYWDRNYTGSGSTNVDGALLTGGTGDLTDGLLPLGNWNGSENAAGTGPYVGWRQGFTSNPLVTFRFGSTVTVNTIVISVDDSEFGGVSVPLSVSIGAAGGPLTTFAITNPAGTAPTSFTFSGLNITANAIDVRFNHRTEWIMVSEVQFDGTTVPEPSAYLLVLGGLALAAGITRRR